MGAQIELTVLGNSAPVAVDGIGGSVIKALSPTVDLQETAEGVQITVTDVNGTQTATVRNGEDGQTGPAGQDGQQGPAGRDGVSPTATVEQTASGAVLTVTDSTGTHTAVLTNGADGHDGADGQDGADGADGKDGADGHDGADGKDGKDGINGTDGVSPTVSVSEIAGGHRVTVTDAEGSTSFDVMDGADGADGANGQNGADGQPGQNGSNGADGYSPSASVTKSGSTATITITDKTGTTTATVSDGAAGDNYVLTNADKAEIAGLCFTTETVSGSTPSITAQENHRYVCGEVTSLSFTPSATGVCDVIFTSGSTATVLTASNTIKWPGWFDPSSLDTNTVYEINVLSGIYGAVMVWGA